jgi:hypothetical protein
MELRPKSDASVQNAMRASRNRTDCPESEANVQNNELSECTKEHVAVAEDRRLIEVSYDSELGQVFHALGTSTRSRSMSL